LHIRFFGDAGRRRGLAVDAAAASSYFICGRSPGLLHSAAPAILAEGWHHG
jgi:hypothetical protein